MILLLACASHGDLPAVAPASIYVEARKVDAGGTIRLHAPDDATVKITPDLAPKDAGDGLWEVRGDKGSYIIEVTPKDAQAPTALYVDIGVDGPTGGPMEDLAALPPPPPPIWPYLLAGVAVLGLIVGIFLLLRKQLKKPAPPPPPEPADVVARRAWAAIRARTELAPEDMAQQLSGVYRAYVEASEGWPATQRTSREILDNLAGMLTAAQLEKARRLLGAMDVVKFADREARAEIFEGLDRDFDALVQRA